MQDLIDTASIPELAKDLANGDVAAKMYLLSVIDKISTEKLLRILRERDRINEELS